MMRINLSARPATPEQAPPRGVWTMTMAVLGAYLGAPSSPAPRRRGIVR